MKPSGCVALRAGDDTLMFAEMKRLYVCERFGGRGVGRLLLESIIGAARERRYKHIRLDSMTGKMDVAISLYRSFGFKQVEYNPMPNATTGNLTFDVRLKPLRTDRFDNRDFV